MQVRAGRMRAPSLLYHYQSYNSQTVAARSLFSPTFVITRRIRDYATVVSLGINLVGTRKLNVSSRITVGIWGCL